MRYCFIILCPLLLTACGTKIAQQLRPLNMIFSHMPAESPLEYQEGWRDGCTSGLSVKTNDFYRTFYRYTLNRDLLTNQYYYPAWKTSFDYCRAYAYGMLKEADLRGSQPHDPIHQQGILNIMDNWGPGMSARW